VRKRQYGVYAQDQIKWQEFVMTAGVRNDWANQATDNRLTDLTTRSDSHAFTGRAGLTYLSRNGVAPYVNYSRSFQPTPGVDFGGRPFDPITGKQTELGLKFASADARFTGSTAIFDLRQQNVLTVDPAHARFLVQTGEIRSKGAELEGRVALTDTVDTTLSYTYLDAEVTHSNGLDLGKRPLNVPKNGAALWAYYSIPKSLVNGLSIGAGLRYVGSTWGDTANTLAVPAFVVTDAVVRWTLPPGHGGRWSAALNAANLFDRDYVSECSSQVNCLYGNRRTVAVTVRYSR
jgi:iron complex outermembrane recepter protein